MASPQADEALITLLDKPDPKAAQADRRLFLLDGHALAYRAHFAFASNPRMTSKGVNTSAAFGFANTLLDLIKNEAPSHIAVIFDTDVPTARHIAYEAYKAQRPPMPEDLRIGIDHIQRMVRAMKIPVLEMDGYEADDVIATLAIKACKEGYDVYMMTPDKDFCQLVRPCISIYKPSRMGGGAEILGVAEVLEKWEITDTKQVIDILALWGDAVDNIPGVPSIGEKTAKKLIGQFGSVEGIYENLDKLTPKQQTVFETNREQAMLSKSLATIDCEVPIEFSEPDFLLEKPDEEALKEILHELEFRTLARRLLGEASTAGSSVSTPDLFGNSQFVSASAPKSSPAEETAETYASKNITNTPHTYTLVQGLEDSKALNAKLLTQPLVCFDTETTGTDANTAALVGLSFSFEVGTGYYVDVPENEAEATATVEAFRPFFESAVPKVAQNLKYDALVLLQHNINLGGELHDTMLAHYVLEPEGKHGMDAMANIYLDYSPVSIETLIGKKGKGQGTMRSVDVQAAADYAAEDADITLQLHEHFMPKLQAEPQLYKLYETVEMPLVPVLAEMEAEGVAIDLPALAIISKELGESADLLEQEVYTKAGMKFNIGSPKQLGEVLFEHLKLGGAKPKKTKTGQYATDETTMLTLASSHEVPQLVLDYRKLLKLKSTYVDALPTLINPKTGRVHTSFNQAVAATGRLSSTAPNLQNIPIRTEKGKEIRKAFIARDKDHVLLSADYSQIELRIITSIAEEEAMAQAFADGLDIHTATAAKVYGVALEDVTSDLRRMAKAINFGIIYGMSSFGLAQRLGIGRGEAGELIKSYFETYPGIKRYMNTQIEKARELGYVETLLGRRRYLRDVTSANPTARGFAERNAINAPIQGSAADMIKLAMIRVQAALNASGLKAKMTLQVHDELVFDVPRGEVKALTELVKHHMTEALPLNGVPVVVETGVGENWLEAH